MRNHSSTKNSRKGIAAVELAVVLPFFVILILGVWEIGRFIEVQLILENAAREGGRQAATGNRTTLEVQNVVYQSMANAGLPVLDAKSNPVKGVSCVVTNLTSGKTPETSSQLDLLKVTVIIPSNMVRWLMVGNFVPMGSNVQAFTVWNSMNNVPLVVSTNIPGAPK